MREMGHMREMGYPDATQASYDELRARYAGTWVDVERIIRGLSGLRCYMHTINHPRPAAQQIIAIELLDRLGLKPTVAPGQVLSLLPDHLGTGPIWPVYPPLARGLGAAGSYMCRCAR